MLNYAILYIINDGGSATRDGCIRISHIISAIPEQLSYARYEDETSSVAHFVLRPSRVEIFDACAIQSKSERPT
jgi:hypothetical protein